MATPPFHVALCFGSGPGADGSPISIVGPAVWSEAPASGVTSSNKAVDGSGGPTGSGQPIFRADAVADSYLSIGNPPNASVSPRHLIKAGVTYDIFVKPGDKFQWVAA